MKGPAPRVHLIRDLRRTDRRTGVKVPEQFACLRIECVGGALTIGNEHQIAGRGRRPRPKDRRSVVSARSARRWPGYKPRDISRLRRRRFALSGRAELSVLERGAHGDCRQKDWELLAGYIEETFRRIEGAGIRSAPLRAARAPHP